MTRLLLLRHAESEWNAVGRWQGQADPPLSERGRAQAREAAADVRDAVARVVSSDLQRATETADIIAAELGLSSVERDVQLREIDVGSWSGLTSEEIEHRWPGVLERWRAGEHVDNGGEDRDTFLERIVAAVRAHALNDGGPVLVVTHGAAIGVLERHLEVHPGSAMPRLAGRWFEVGEQLRAVGERVQLGSS